MIRLRRDGASIARYLRDRPASIAAMALLLAALAFILVIDIRSPQKDDVAWLLYVARRWLGGQRLYEDIVEVNPPLIVWLYALPALAAEWLGTAPRLLAAPFFALCMLGSAWWSATLLHGRGPLFAHRVPAFGVIGTLLLILPGVEFGQREHLLIAAVLPYLCLFTRELDGEAEPRGTAAAAGILAGLGCALKPTYALAFALLELIAALRGRRPVRVASVAAVAAIAAYGAVVLLFVPAYLDKAVPLALALYGGTDTPFWQIVADSRWLLIGQAVALLLCWSSRATLAPRSSFQRHLLLALTAFAGGSTLVFMLQGKNWFYHRLPATEATVLALLLWLIAMLTARPLPWRRLLPAPLVLAALFGFALADYDRLTPWVQAAAEPELTTAGRLERLIRKEKAHTYIAFSEWIALGFPVVNDTGVTWASRFDSMWALRGELWRAKQDGSAPKQWPIARWVAEDFVAACPDLAVVDKREGINYVGVLIASDAGFARAWSHYHEIAAFNGLSVLHRDAAGCLPPRPPRKRLHLSALATGEQ